MLSICLATRERPDHFRRMCESALKTAHDPSDIEFVIYRDDDDKSDYTYIGNHKEIIGKRDKLATHMVNECQAIASGPIYMFIADDFIFETMAWDKIVKDEFAKYEDRLVLICPNNNEWGAWKFGVVGFLHREWIEKVGYFMPPFSGASPDRWINEIASTIGRRVRLKNVVVSHTNVRDQVHKDKNRRGHIENKKYDLYAEQRQKDIETLQGLINAFA